MLEHYVFISLCSIVDNLIISSTPTKQKIFLLAVRLNISIGRHNGCIDLSQVIGDRLSFLFFFLLFFRLISLSRVQDHAFGFSGVSALSFVGVQNGFIFLIDWI